MKCFHLVSVLLIVKCIHFGLANQIQHSLTEKFTWKSVEFSWPNDATREDAIIKEYYKAENNLPMGLDVWGDKLFITVPRWKTGVASSLNYVNLTNAQNEKSPKLVPYPNWESNLLKIESKNNKQIATENVTENVTEIPVDKFELPDNATVISTFQIRVDKCDRLWVMDTGLADILGETKQLAPPALLIFNLKADKLIRRYTFKPSDIKSGSLFANVIVDIPNSECNNAHAYVADLGAFGVVVYSFKDNKSWRVRHNFFHFDPMSGDFNVGGVNFQLTDGVLGMALGKASPEGVRKVYFHAFSSITEFSVPNFVLKNETRATSSNSYYDFSLIGSRGSKGQSSAEFFDEKNDILFYTQPNKDAIGCWNANKPYTPETQGIVDSNSESLVFPNDIKIDRTGNLWVLSNRMPVFKYKRLSLDHFNFRILVGKASEVIKGTPCDPNYENKKKP